MTLLIIIGLVGLIVLAIVVEFNDGRKITSDDYKNKLEAEIVLNSSIKKRKGEKQMVKGIKDTIGKFLEENKMFITWIAVLFLADHFFFGGKFRERLYSMVEKVIGKIEKKAEEIK